MEEDKMRHVPRTLRFTLPTLGISWVLLGALSANAQTYKVIDLGTLPGDDNSVAHGINNAGQVVGSSVLPGSSDPVVNPDKSHAFLYEHGQLSDLGLNGATSQALGVAGGIGIDPSDKDDDRRKTRVTGSFGSAPEIYAFLYQDHLLRNLGRLPGGSYSIGHAVNRRGEVVGVADNASGLAHPFLYKNGNLIDLGGSSAMGFGTANGINDRGDVTGFAELPNLDAFLYKDGKLIDIGGLPGALLSVGSAINHSRQIAGTSSGNNSTAWLWEKGMFTSLGALPTGSNSSAYGMNSFGEVVGSADVNDDPSGSGIAAFHAFLYSQGKMQDLNSMIPSNSGWVLNVAEAINDRQEIVGSGTIDGKSHAFLLKLDRKHSN
jgi:probable HAF family extracellular repeat protein